MAKVYGKIATVEVGSGGAADIDIQNIPAIYTDLYLLLSLRDNRSNTDNEIYVKFNNNTTGYSFRRLSGDGSSATSGSGSSYPMLTENSGTSTSNTFASSTIYISNYAGSNNKSFSIDSVMENNATLAYSYMVAGLWSNSAAISRITLTPFSGSFVQYSTATLYGIRKTANPL